MDTTISQRAYLDGLDEEASRLEAELVRVKHAIANLNDEERELYRRKNLVLAELAAAKAKYQREDAHVAGRQI